MFICWVLVVQTIMGYLRLYKHKRKRVQLFLFLLSMTQLLLSFSLYFMYMLWKIIFPYMLHKNEHVQTRRCVGIIMYYIVISLKSKLAQICRFGINYLYAPHDGKDGTFREKKKLRNEWQLYWLPGSLLHCGGSMMTKCNYDVTVIFFLCVKNSSKAFVINAMA